jgi:hypothetical protein
MAKNKKKKAEKAAKKNAKKAQEAAAASAAKAAQEAATAGASKAQRAASAGVKRAEEAATAKRTVSHLPGKTRTAPGKQGAAVAQRRRTGAASPKTRAELYEIAKKRDLPGRSRMGRDELAKALGER